ncbi:two-component system response regulator BaeR [Ahniella affigens]|uniref:Two-component system response regulator BaeR n=1 Tax=Ahniella affigens TaxID=2021234 RepID=A0A2P1PR33_9GAMM|nr:response regulator [Ahniella affigens]AVP97294.1 two-component system response regulator BaeR [Ahniella affigens]
MNPPRILIVEDEPRLASVLVDYLRHAGMNTHWLDHGDLVLPWLKQEPCSLMLLDQMLPGRDGLSILTELRQTSFLPVIVVTAQVRDIDRMLGLDSGADDYVCKPFNPNEVVARVKAVLRRSRQGGADTSSPQPLIVLDQAQSVARWRGQELALTQVEFRILEVLVRESPRIVSRQQLLGSMYTDHRVVTERTVDTHIRNLRRKFQEVAANPIDSVYGVGFRFDMSVT